MKKFLICSLIFIVQLCYSQKVYHLDYALEFELSTLNEEESKKSNHIFYVNSKDNGIIMNLYEEDGINCELNFSDRKKLSVFSKVKKSDFIMAESIQNSCESVYKYSFQFDDKVKKYKFINLNDTIINGVVYYHYKAINIKQKKKKNVNDVHYIVDKSSADFLPFLNNSTAYELWKKERNIPNGLPFLIFYKNRKDIITFKMQLKKYTTIKKQILIPDDCELQVKKISLFNFK